MAETGAGVLGSGIVDKEGIGPVEGTETVENSHRRVNLSAGDGPPDRKAVYDGFNRSVCPMNNLGSKEVSDAKQASSM